MKILALEREMESARWNDIQKLLKQEAKQIFQLYLSDSLREIYFTENKNAILIFECEDQIAAKNLLNTLPLVKKGIIRFETTELHPYTGFNRLMKLE